MSEDDEVEVEINGNTSLQEQEDSLNFSQNLARGEVTSYVKGDPTKNIAKLKRVAIGAKVRPLRLTTSAGSTGNDNPIFEGEVYVGGIETAVKGCH